MPRTLKTKPQPEPDFYISAVKDGDGYTYSLSPGPRDWLKKQAPHATPSGRIFIAQDTQKNFSQTQERIAPFLVPMLLGISISEVRKLGDIPFCHPFPFQILFTWGASENTSQSLHDTAAPTPPTR